MERLHFQLIRNALFGAGGRLATLLVGLFMTPYLFHQLGRDRFGFWALVPLVTGIAGFLDFGFRTSFTKFMAEVQARHDMEGMSRLLSTALFYYGGFTLAVGPLFVFVGRHIITLLAIPPPLRDEAFGVLLIAMAGFFVSSILAVFPAMCDAAQRMDLTNKLGVVALILGAAMTVFALESGTGLLGVAVAQTLSISFFYISSIFVARSVVGPVSVSIRRIDNAWFARLFSFGLKLHVSTICATVNRHLDKFLLSRFAVFSWVSSYELGLRLVANTGSFQPMLAAGLLPAASQLDTLGERERLIQIYRTGSRYLFLVGVAPFVFLATNAEVVLTAWLGRPEPEASMVLVILAGGYMVNSLSNAMAYVCQGVGHPEIQSRQAVLQLLTNVVSSLILLLVFGPLGAPLGTTLALFLGAWYLAWRFHQRLGLSSLELFQEVGVVPIVASVLAALPSCFVGRWLPAATRGDAMLNLSVSGLLFITIYVSVCMATGFVGRRELGRLWAFLAARERAGA